MPRLPRCASARRSSRHLSMADRQMTSIHGQNMDDDFMDEPPRVIRRVKYVAPVSRCIPSSISSIVKIFNVEQKELVREMGFGGILRMPDIVNNREFSHWILSRVSCSDMAIRIGDGSLLYFSEEDVNKVLGIPCMGKELDNPSTDLVANAKNMICDRLGVNDYKNVNRALLDGILTKVHRCSMSEDDKTAFKTAFLMLVMTKFLAPQSYLDNICPRYFSALINADDITNWNWSRYVINEIISAARALQNKLSDGTKCSYVNVCVIFLQIFYLDNLDFGPLNLKHDVFPRIRVYDRDTIKIRVHIDLKLKDQYKATQYGKMQLRPIIDICYTRLNGKSKSINGGDCVAGPSEVNPEGQHQVVQHAAQILKQAKVMNSFLVSCLSHMDKAREDLARVAEASRFLGSFDHTSTDEDILSRGYTCTIDDEADDISQHLAHGRTSPVCTEVVSSEHMENNMAATPIVTDQPTYEQEYTPTLVIDSGSNTSLDLNRSVPLQQETRSIKNPTYPRPILVDIVPPSFDLCLDLSPLVKKSKDKQIFGTNKTAHMQDDVQSNAVNGTCMSAEGAPEVTQNKACMSPRSRSREIAVSSLIVLEDIYIENSQEEIRPARGIKREYLEPKLLDFGQFTPDKHQHHRLKTATSSPFDCTASVHARPEHVSSVLIDWIRNYQDGATLRSSWVAHAIPTNITLTGMELRNFIEGNDRVDYATISIYTRRLIEMEFENFGNTEAYGWRHFLEPDFAIRAIASDSWWNPEVFRHQFTGPEIKYDVSKCEIIFVPMCDLNHWCCYAFNLRKRVVHILDSNKIEKGEEIRAGSNHAWIVPMLATAMQQCLTLFFSDWNEDLTKWLFKEPIVPTHYFEVESGIYTLEYMKNWNGTKCVRELNPDCMDKVRTDILMDMLTLKANTASPPDFVKELLKQYTAGAS